MTNAALDKVGLILIGDGSKLPHNRENLENVLKFSAYNPSLRLSKLPL